MVKLFTRSESPYWYAELDVGGETHRFSTRVPASPAFRKRAREVADHRREQLEREAAQQHSFTLIQALHDYFQDPSLNIKDSTAKLYARKMAIVVNTLGNIPLSAVTPELVRTYMKDRRGQTSDIQVRHELTALSAVLEFAVENELPGAPTHNPVRLVSKKRLGKASDHARFLQPHEVQRLLDAAQGRRFWAAFIRLILETGMRHEEALGLRWSEVDLEKGTIKLSRERDKAKRDRLIPLTTHSLNTLAGIARDPLSEYVFTNPGTRTRYVSIYRGWTVLRKRAGLPKARIHDLRHTFASWVRQLGMSREDRMSIMGHTTVEAHELYAAGSVQTLRELLGKHSPHSLLPQSRKL